MLILAIDPGSTESGFCRFDGGDVLSSGNAGNVEMLELIRLGMFDVLAIEMVASYGMAVGQDVFETVRWIGRFQQACAAPDSVILVFRKAVKLHLCGSYQAKDSNVRQALLDRFPRTGGGKTPQVGTAKTPGPLYGVSTHAWSALAVATYAAHQLGLSEAA